MTATHETLPATEAYRAYLAARCEEVQSFPIDGLDRLGVPVWNVSAWGAVSAHGVGYGETPEEAERSAFGEAVETMAAARWNPETLMLPVEEAMREGAVHPARLSPVLGADVPGHRPFLWVDAETWPAGEQRLLPLEAVATSPSEARLVAANGLEPLFPPITNGLGAGTGGREGIERAVAHGLRELLQRDLNWSQFKALDTGRAVDAEAIAPDLVARLRAAGVEPVLKYSGRALGVHAFHCAGIDRDPALPAVARTATGEGADEDPRVAARKALLEFCSSRARKQFFFGGPGALRVAPPAYRERVAALEAKGATELGWDLVERFDALLGDPAALERVVGRITQVRETVPLPPPGALDLGEAEVVVVPLTGPGDEAQVVRVTVPGLEAEVLSHHRIGPRALARLRERLPEAVRADGAVDVALLERLAADFLPLYREPDRHGYASP